MSYERYTTKTGRMMLVLSKWRKLVKQGEIYTYVMTTVDILEMDTEETRSVSYLEFDKWLREGKLTRLLPIKKT